MSLKIWLPLTKDLRNQGLDNVTVTNNGATFNADGKLGGCYSFGTSNSYITIDSAPLKTFTEFSFACWVKIISWNTNYSTIFAIKNSTGVSWNNLIFSLLRDSSSSTLCFNISNGSNYTSNSCRTEALSLNTWYHITCTYKNGQIKLYQDGNIVSTYNTSVVPNFNSIVNLWIGKSNENSYQSNNLLNDIRIYDHCLSPFEVKQISQGLVLHYPLADIYVEETTNLITTEDCLSSTCYNASNGKYSYGTATDMYKTITTYDGRKGTKVYMGTNGNDCFPYVYINNMYTSDGTNSPAYKTLSFDYYTTISTSISPYKLGSGNGTATYIVSNSSGTETGTGVNSVVIPVVPNIWNHIEITFHGTTTADSQWGYITNRPAHVSNTDNFWFFANMQLEAKDHATGYAGVGGTRSSNMIYDCSGFCNNGTISGTLAISNDTPKYKASTYMPAATTITHTRCLDNSDQEWSCAAWVKPKVAGNYQNLNNFNEFNRLYHGTYPLLYANTGTNDYYNYGNLALPVNQWSHIVFVFKNSTGTKLIYINGENHTNMSGPNKTSTPKGIPDNVIIGNGNYEGGLCDYREYATALSAEDVKSLYQNSAYIDN